MDVNKVVVSVVTTVLKILVVIMILFLVFQGGRRAYQFGRAIYLDEAITTPENARGITVTVSEGDLAMDIGNMLERKGLIKSAKVFYVQALLCEDGNHLKAGSYQLNTAMNAEEIMHIMASQQTSEPDNE